MTDETMSVPDPAWVVVDRHGQVCDAYGDEHRAKEDAEFLARYEPMKARGPFRVVQYAAACPCCGRPKG